MFSLLVENHADRTRPYLREKPVRRCLAHRSILSRVGASDKPGAVHFLNAYLASKGAQPVNLDPFRTLPSSRATGANQIGRLTNLMQLTIDTSWYTRYRSSIRNPDLDPGFKIPAGEVRVSPRQYPAIPRDDGGLAPARHIQAIANAAAFHFCLIEQGEYEPLPVPCAERLEQRGVCASCSASGRRSTRKTTLVAPVSSTTNCMWVG